MKFRLSVKEFIYRYINSKSLLAVILLLALFLRVYKLGTIPPHLTPDEASLGYNAYSILKTGKDEYGEVLPMVFKSFGDYKPGLYIYLTVPFVALFGLTELAVRLPSALGGVFVVYFIYLITEEMLELTQKSKSSKKNNIYKLLPIISAGILAINPWHVHFSRGAWEANLSLTFTLAGIVFFLKSVNKKKVLNIIQNEQLILSAIFFAFSYITYQGAKLSTTLVILILALVFNKEVIEIYKKKRKSLYISSILGVLICFPVILSLFTGRTGRLEVFSVFSYPRPIEYTQEFLDQGQEKIGDLNYYIFHSESLNFTRGVLGRYFNHFSARFLFFEGDWQNLRHSAPHQGMMLIISSILVVLGSIRLIKRSDKFTVFVFGWLLMAPLPAALSRDQVQAVRSLNMLIPLVIISSFGFYQVVMIGRKYTNKLIRTAYFSGFVILYLASFIYFLDAYFVHIPINDAEYWNYGYKQVFVTLSKEADMEDKIVFQQSYSQPYIYYLFYNQVDPKNYQAQADLADSGLDVGLVSGVDNIEFLEYSWPPPADSGDIIVGDTVVIPKADPDGYELIRQIDYPEGKPAFRIIRKK